MSKSIVHILFRDKFTSAYIDFMCIAFSEYKHNFYTIEKGMELDTVEGAEIIYYKNLTDMNNNPAYAKNMADADIVVISGVFGLFDMLTHMPDDVLKKTFLQFWGGDFYPFTKEAIRKLPFIDRIKSRIKIPILSRYFSKSAGIINLVKGDWKEFQDIFSCKARNFIAPVPASPRKRADYSMYRKPQVKQEGAPYKILVGNSATETNHHIEVFKVLSRFKDENVRFVVPLSYGKDNYRDMVLEKGREILGDAFEPVVDYMSLEAYIEMLNSCDAGVFNNDRQQGMGNINIMLAIGKKVYARANTSMFESYTDDSIILHDIKELEHLSLEDVVSITKDEAEKNMINIDARRDVKRQTEMWRVVFSSL